MLAEDNRHRFPVSTQAWHGLLRAEGFTEIAYIEAPRQEFPQAFADGRVDFSVTFIVNHIQAIDRGAPITILAGVHAGCYVKRTSNYVDLTRRAGTLLLIARSDGRSGGQGATKRSPASHRRSRPR